MSKKQNGVVWTEALDRRKTFQTTRTIFPIKTTERKKCASNEAWIVVFFSNHENSSVQRQNQRFSAPIRLLRERRLIYGLRVGDWDQRERHDAKKVSAKQMSSSKRRPDATRKFTVPLGASGRFPRATRRRSADGFSRTRKLPRRAARNALQRESRRNGRRQSKRNSWR